MTSCSSVYEYIKDNRTNHMCSFYIELNSQQKRFSHDFSVRCFFWDIITKGKFWHGSYFWNYLIQSSSLHLWPLKRIALETFCNTKACCVWDLSFLSFFWSKLHETWSEKLYSNKTGVVHSSCMPSGGSKGGREGRTPPPLCVQILSISCSFWENLAKLRVHAPPLEGSRPPPLGKSWIRHCVCPSDMVAQLKTTWGTKILLLLKFSKLKIFHHIIVTSIINDENWPLF